MVNLAGMDLNLLLVFDAVMSTRNATRAGERIGMSQPAVSNALNRLRHTMRDDLFVRGAEGMRPTARALELEMPIRRALASIENALDPIAFDPKTATRTFTIATADYVAMTLLPYIAEYITQEAPGINVHTVPIEGRLYEKLDHQEADYGLMPLADIPDRFGRRQIAEDHFVCMMRKDHPLARYKKEIPIEAYAAARHLLVTPRGDAHGFVDEQLAEMGLSRRIVMTINHFGSAPMLITSSDMIVTVPSRMADKCCQYFDVHIVPSPVSPPASFIGGMLVWHKRLTNHPAHIWFQDLVARAGHDLEKYGLKTGAMKAPDLQGLPCMG